MTSRTLFVAIIVSVAAGITAFVLLPKPLPELSRHELIEEVRSGHVHEVVVIDGDTITAVSTSRGPFRTDLPHGSSLIEELRALGVEVKFEKTPPGLI